MDVGCAEGLYTQFLAYKREYSIGIDISKPKLIRARERYHAINLQFIVADAEHLPFRDNSFDLTLCIDVLRCLRNPEKAIKELFRVSRYYISRTTLRNFGSIKPRDISSIKEIFASGKPFAGSLWLISSIGLIKLIKALSPNIKILKVIVHPFALMDLIFHVVRVLRDSALALKFAEVIDSFTQEKRVLNLLGMFTTVLLKK